MRNGLRYVYTGNVHDRSGSSTYCPGCSHRVIERDWYVLGGYHVGPDGRCEFCATPIPGHYDTRPGTWGARRQPVVLDAGAAPAVFRRRASRGRRVS
jgi:pyruvate formate lyase activating enzyme